MIFKILFFNAVFWIKYTNLHTLQQTNKIYFQHLQVFQQLSTQKTVSFLFDKEYIDIR